MAEEPKKLALDYVETFPKIDSLLYNELLKYILNGEFPQNNSQNFFLQIYNFAAHYANKDEEASDLYQYFKKIISTNSMELAKQLDNVSNTEIIDRFIDICNRMEIIINFMLKAFSYVDFYYVKSKTIPTLAESALEIYRTNIFMPFQNELTNEVNKLLKEDRFGKTDNRVKIKKILLIMKTMDLYKPKIYRENNNIVWINDPKDVNQEQHTTPIQDFWFDNFKKDTEQFVTAKAIQDIQNRSTPEYVLIELKFLEEERERQKELINPIFYERLNAIIYEQIIGRNMVELVEMDSGVNNMLVNNKYEELKNIFELFKVLEKSLHEIAKIFRAYIEKRGSSLRENKEIYKDPKKMVPLLIDLQKEINTLVKKCFKDNDILQAAKDRAFFEFMKADYYSKQVAYYLDFCMRSGFKGKSEQDINSSLNDIINLFKNLNSKYVFQKETEKKMSDRLIKRSTLSINNEKIFVSKLKQESDNSLVSKMVTMLSDLDKNKNESEDYKKTKCHGAPNGIKFDVQIVSNSAWEISNKYILPKINLPPLLQGCIEDFTSYYKIKYAEHKLIWYLGFSTLEIQYLYLKNKNISKSTLPQVLILLELEKCEPASASIKKLAQNLKLDIDLIKDNIQGLVFNIAFNPKCQSDKGILLPSNLDTKTFSETDEFKIKKDFVSIKQRISTIPMPKKKTEEEIKSEEKQSEEDYKKYRDYLIQANLIRIMKSRIGQVTSHNWLVNETAKQIDKLKVQPQMVKDNIEKLIEKNYIKRDEKNKGCYEYVA